jgi:tRNA pseudouridine38-40 synthase
MRIALGLEYDGCLFFGWQKQQGLQTIQGSLEQALGQIADAPIEVYCAGRTDAGVHAVQQIVHFDTNTIRDLRAWVMGTNSFLPSGIVVHWAQEIDENFHARFSALSRCYTYVIDNSPIRPALLAKKVTWYFEPLNIESMKAASVHLLGELDFSSFRSAECSSKTPMRNVQKINITRNGNYIMISIQANAFLHHMVRNIVGVLKKIGAGFEEPHWAREVLEARDRRAAAETTPPDGLYLMKVGYPVQYQFPITTKIPIIP